MHPQFPPNFVALLYLIAASLLLRQNVTTFYTYPETILIILYNNCIKYDIIWGELSNTHLKTVCEIVFWGTRILFAVLT